MVVAISAASRLVRANARNGVVKRRARHDRSVSRFRRLSHKPDHRLYRSSVRNFRRKRRRSLSVRHGVVPIRKRSSARTGLRSLHGRAAPRVRSVTGVGSKAAKIGAGTIEAAKIGVAKIGAGTGSRAR